MEQLQQKIAIQTKQLREKDFLLKQKANELQATGENLQDHIESDQIEQHQTENSHLQEDIASRERKLRQLNQQLEEQKQVIAEIQQTNHSLQRGIKQLQQQLSQ